MWFQTPEYLRWSRLHLLKPEHRQHIINCIGIMPGDRVLDVGCGSGELIRYLAEGVDAKFLGIDLDESLIKAAKENTCANISFIQADALELPFEEDSFDVVISHTFFTAVFQAECAMEQMRRVCKNNGKIASITADSIQVLPHSPGVYPDYLWYPEYRRLRTKMDLAFRKEAQRCCVGVLPEDMPRFFAEQGLLNVQVNAIEKFSCLSNMDLKSRETYLQLEYESDMSRLQLLPEDDRNNYAQLLRMRKEDLLSPENSIWDWSCGTNLLIVGTNKKENFDTTTGNNLKALKKIALDGEDVSVIEKRANAGSFATAVLKSASERDLYGTGDTPTKALESVYKKLISRKFAGYNGVCLDAEELLKDNDLLIQSLQVLNHTCTDYIQEVKQWENKSVAYEFVDVKTNESFLLPQWLLQWCYGEHSCSIGNCKEQARSNSLYELCSYYVLKKIATRQLTPPKLDESLLKAVPEVYTAYVMLRDRGIHVQYFDGSLGLGLPVIGAYAIGQGGAKLRVCGGDTLEEAMTSCMAALFENCTLDNFFSTRANISSKVPSYAQLYNLLNTGEGYMPESVLKTKSDWDVLTWDDFKVSLLEHLTNLGFKIYRREFAFDNIYFCQTIVAEEGMLYNFGNERLLEYTLRKLSIPVLRNLTGASEKERTLAMKYVELKRDWFRENTFAYLANIKQNPKLFDVDIDAPMLLGLNEIARGQYDTALRFFKEYNGYFSCFRALLSGMDENVLCLLYSGDAVKKSKEVIAAPFNVLSLEGLIYD